MVNRLGPSRTLIDRVRGARAPVTSRVGQRGALASRAGQITGRGPGGPGGGLEGMRNHPAVGFGRQMTASPAQGQIDSITGGVRGDLASKGIYKDEFGTFQISGMERSDPSRAIRDAAVAAMDPTGEMSRRVAYGDSLLNPEGAWDRPDPRISTADKAIPGISDVMSARAAEVGKPPDPSSFPQQPGSRPSIPAGSPGTVVSKPAPTPGPGTVVSTPAPAVERGKPPAPTLGLPPGGIAGGHGVTERLPVIQAPQETAKPPMPVIQSPQETAKPPAPAPSLGLPRAGIAGGTLPVATVQPAAKPAAKPNTPPATTPAAKPPAPTPGTQTSTPAATPAMSGYAHPDSAMSGMMRTPGPGERGINPSTGEPVYGPGTIPSQSGQPEQAKPPAPSPAPGGPGSRTTPAATSPAPPSGGPGTRTTPAGTSPTPTGTGLPPGTIPRQPAGTPGQTPSVPGTTTASRPGGAWPTEKLGPFGTDDGGSSMFPPGFPFNDRAAPGTAGSAGDLANLGSSIQQRVQEAISGRGDRGITPGMSASIPGLEGLGDRIRSVVTQGQQDLQSRMAGMGLNGLPQPGTTPGGMSPGGMSPGGTLPVQPGGMAPGTIPQQPGGTVNAPAPQPPTGTGGTLGSYGNQSIDQWDDAFIAAGNQYGVDPTLLKAMAEIESGGNGNIPLDQCRDDGYGDGGSCGLMQIKPGIWGSVGSTEEQIMQAAKILDDAVESGQYATHRDALFGIYFPMDDPNGTTQGSYGAKVDQLMGQMGPYQPAQPGTDPGALPPGTIPQQGSTVPPDAVPGPGGLGAEGPIHVPVNSGDYDDQSWMQTTLPGGNPVVTSPYMAEVTWNADYSYQNGHGADAYHHAGYDIGVPENTPVVFEDTLSGQVVCGGMPGTNPCTAYGSDNGGGSGGVEVLLDNQGNNTISMVYGHLNSSNVSPGQYVGPGTQLGLSGTAGTGPHLHLEARAYCPGQGYVDDWKFIDPGLVSNGYYQTHDACQG